MEFDVCFSWDEVMFLSEFLVKLILLWHKGGMWGLCSVLFFLLVQVGKFSFVRIVVHGSSSFVSLRQFVFSGDTGQSAV